MKRPVVGLLIAGQEAKEAVVRGWKTITIREGHRDYQVGDRLALFCPWLNWSVFAEVTYVWQGLIREVPEQDLRDDGYETHLAMLEDLKSFGGAYATMTLDSPVTVIRWGDVQGKLVNEIAISAIYREYNARHRSPIPARRLRAKLFDPKKEIFGPGVKFESVLQSLVYNKWVEVSESDDPYVRLTTEGLEAAHAAAYAAIST